MNAGILLISCGPQHDALAARCINSIMRVSQLPIHVHRENLRGFASREAKLKMDLVTPFDTTLYLDCDTLVLRDPQFIMEDFDKSGENLRMAVDPATPDAGRMLVHPYYKQTLDDATMTTLAALPRQTPHFNTGVILFQKGGFGGWLFDRWRKEWSAGPREQDEPYLMASMYANPRAFAGKLDPRWNFLCNPEKKDDVIREGIRKAGILHLCGLNKAKNYSRITELLASCSSSRNSRRSGAPA
jgi:hypothetical protein